MEDPKKLYEERRDRIMKAIHLEKPDRVPIAPKMGNFYAQGYGVSMYNMIIDMRNCKASLRQFLTDYQPDMVLTPSSYSLNTMEAADAKYLAWPGPECGIELNSMTQAIGESYLEDDEIDEFILDPTHTVLTKVIPRKCGNLAGFSKLYLRDPGDKRLLSSLKKFADPDVKKAIEWATRAGEAQIAYDETCKETYAIIKEMGFPKRNSVSQSCPFDSYADNIRGVTQTVMDTAMYPEQLDEVMKIMTATTVKNTKETVLKKKPDFLYIPMHCGMDGFMSPDSYARFYWPGLKALVEAMVEVNVVPILFCQGKYFTRFDFLSSLPKGKVAFMFEQTDMKVAKERLGDVGCLFGNVSTTALAYGKPQEVIDETKKLIDTCAGGGGFIMDCSIVIDNVKHENLHAMFDTTLTYGKY